MGGGNSGPSAADIASEDQAAAEEAQSQANEMSEEQQVEKQRNDQAAVALAAKQANATSLLAQHQQMVIAGIAGNENNNVENPVVTKNPAVTGNLLSQSSKSGSGA